MSVSLDSLDIDKAIAEFDGHQQGFDESLSYYEAEERDFAIGVATPPQMRSLLALIGVPRVYVDAMVDRLTVEGFRIGSEASPDEELWSWWQANALDVEAPLGHTEALVYGRAYVTVAAPSETDPGINDPTIPIIRVESPRALYAQINPLTRLPDWAVRVIRDSDNKTVGATLYTPDSTVLYQDVDGQLTQVEQINHGLGVVPVVPLRCRFRASDLEGSSIISSELRSVTDAMSRLMMNLQATSELMAVPQRVIFGASREELLEPNQSALELYISSYITVEDTAGSVQQFSAADLRNYTEALTSMLKLTASYTGLPPQYLSVQSENPASAEAIKASESRLVRRCESLAVGFGEAWEQVMRLAMLVMGRPLDLDAYRMETVWRDPGTPTYQAKVEAAVHAYNGGNGIIPKQQARLDIGYTAEQIRQMELWDQESPMSQLASLYGASSVGSVTGDGTSEPAGDGDSEADNGGGVAGR